MSEDNIVVDANHRFRGGAESPEQKSQARVDGAKALEALKACKRLPLEDREQIARKIGFFIHGWSREKRAKLSKSFDPYDPKELYRLVLSVGEELSDKYRLRSAGKRYAALIETLAPLLRPPTDKDDLADRVTRGTSVHPSDKRPSSDAGKILNLLYLLADGIDRVFDLTQMFRAISLEKVALPQRDSWALWPAQLGEDDWEERDRLNALQEPLAEVRPWEERLQSSFWIVRTEEEREQGVKRLKLRSEWTDRELSEEAIQHELFDQTFGFENWHWDQIIGYLPHFFLGHQRDFPWDRDFWPRPPNLILDGKEEQLWEDRLEDDVFGVIGSQTTISTEWDDRSRLLFNGDPSDVYRRRIYKFQIMTNSSNDPDNRDVIDDDNEEDISPTDPPAFFWLCLYPNADATGLVPVLLSTDWNHGNENTIEPLDERMLTNLDRYSVLGGETLGARLRRALYVKDVREEPTLQAEWRRTARFVARHPLWRKHMEYEATERHIKKWLEQVLKSGPYHSDRQEGES